MTEEEEELRFFAAIGRTFSKWAGVEEKLCATMSMLMYSDLKSLDEFMIPAARATFDSLESFRARLQVIDALMQIVGFDQTTQETWATLREKLRRKATLRNNLAHHDVMVDGLASPGRRFKVVLTKSGGYHLADIERIHQQIFDVSMELLDLYTLLRRDLRRRRLSESQA